MKTFHQYLQERVLSIGLNPSHEKYRHEHKDEMHNMLQQSYVKAGGYGGRKSGSKEESDAIHADLSNPVRIIDKERYARQIGDDEHEKVMMGHPKED